MTTFPCNLPPSCWGCSCAGHVCHWGGGGRFLQSNDDDSFTFGSDRDITQNTKLCCMLKVLKVSAELEWNGLLIFQHQCHITLKMRMAAMTNKTFPVKYLVCRHAVQTLGPCCSVLLLLAGSPKTIFLIYATCCNKIEKCDRVLFGKEL